MENNNISKKQLKLAFSNKLIDEATFKEKLFELETRPKEIKRKAQRLPKSLTDEEFTKLIKTIPEKDKISKISFLISYESGLRISEIVGSKDLENKIPALTRENFNLDSKPYQMKIYGKYSKERIVPVPKRWKAYMFKILPIKLTARSLQRRFKKYARKAKLNEDYSFHSLRHGFTNRCVEKGIPLPHIQYMLGHANLSTTSLYATARPIKVLNTYEELF